LVDGTAAKTTIPNTDYEIKTTSANLVPGTTTTFTISTNYQAFTANNWASNAYDRTSKCGGHFTLASYGPSDIFAGTTGYTLSISNSKTA
jgi:hypothetical protein